MRCAIENEKLSSLMLMHTNCDKTIIKVGKVVKLFGQKQPRNMNFGTVLE